MKSKDLYFRLLRYARPHSRILGAAVVGTLMAGALEPVFAALLKPLLDGSFVEKDPWFINYMPILLAGVFMLRGLAGFVSVVAIKWVIHRVLLDLREQMFRKLLVLPTQRFDDWSSGALLSKFNYDATQVMLASAETLVILLRDSVAVVGLLAWMFYLNWELSLIMFLIAPGMAITVRLVSNRLRRLSRKLQAIMGDFNHIVDEAIQGHKVIKIFGGEDYELGRFDRANNAVRRFNMKLAVASEASSPFIQFLIVLALAFVVYVAARQAAADQITVGGFVSLFGAMTLMLAPIKRLTRVNERLQRGLAAAESVFALIDEQPEPDRGTRSLARARGRLGLRGVTFRYESRDYPVLRDIDLDVKPGETIALVGPSGSGKTTLANLLPRLYEPTAGKIYLDGVDIATLKLADLRANLSYVGQDVVLFNDTLAANIAYGASRAVDEAEIVEVAKKAYAMEFIRELPDGLDTLIGENGVRLSGGQRQRVAIARALLKDAPVLILDEATSSLDTHSERQVQRALEHLQGNRTAIIIAHRLSTIENADRIVVMHQGRIVETGTHQELLARQGVYASLYQMQAA
jgi:subfamily B ATP-binding cassette protein MsbA